MAYILKRPHPSGRVVWRVFFSRKNYPGRSWTFESEEEAIIWIEENEESYLLDPVKFLSENPNTLENQKRRGYSISIRKTSLENGVESWRVHFRKSGYTNYSRSFSSKEEAIKWTLENKELYQNNPEMFQKFSKKTIEMMKEKGLRGFGI